MVNANPKNPLMVRVEDLEFSVRTTGALKFAGVKTIGQLTMMSEHELMRLPNFGRRSVSEVREMLNVLGLKLREGPILTLEEQMQEAIRRARKAKNEYEAALSDVANISRLIVNSPITDPEG